MMAAQEKVDILTREERKKRKKRTESREKRAHESGLFQFGFVSFYLFLEWSSAWQSVR